MHKAVNENFYLRFFSRFLAWFRKEGGPFLPKNDKNRSVLTHYGVILAVNDQWNQKKLSFIFMTRKCAISRIYCKLQLSNKAWNYLKRTPKTTETGRKSSATGWFLPIFSKRLCKVIITIATRCVIIWWNASFAQIVSLFLALFACRWRLLKNMSYVKDAFWGNHEIAKLCWK